MLHKLQEHIESIVMPKGLQSVTTTIKPPCHNSIITSREVQNMGEFEGSPKWLDLDGDDLGPMRLSTLMRIPPPWDERINDNTKNKDLTTPSKRKRNLGKSLLKTTT